MLNQIVELINKNIPEASATLITAEVGDSAISIEAKSVKAVCELMKNNEEIPFNSLQVISGVDYTSYIEVNYFLNHIDLESPRQVLIKTQVTDRMNATLDSVSHVWRAAEWQERECYDMFGVTFTGHQDLRRILCPDDWQGFPLRRDYMAPKVYNGMNVFPEEKMNTADREFKVRQKMIEKEAQAKAEATSGSSEGDE